MSIRSLNWMIRIGAKVLTPENPGNLKGAISLDYNSVGACVGGELTFEGYVDWPPYSEFVQVWAAGRRIGLGVIGIPGSTRSETGKRTTRVPIVGLHALDAEGLAALGLGTAFPEVGVSSGVQLLGIPSPLQKISTQITEEDALGLPVTSTVLIDPPFGETVDAGFKRVFKENPLASWGVRPDGVRVAGIASGGDEISSDALNVRAQPSNYELTNYVSEFAERPGERWRPQYRARELWRMTPRRGTTAQSEELATNLTEAAPVTLQKVWNEEMPSQHGYLIGVVPVSDIVKNSLNNPALPTSNYVPLSISIDIQIEFQGQAQPETPPAGWAGENIYPLGTWQDSEKWKYLQLLKANLDAGAEPNYADILQYIAEQGNSLVVIPENPFPDNFFGMMWANHAANIPGYIKDIPYWKRVAEFHYFPIVDTPEQFVDPAFRQIWETDWQQLSAAATPYIKARLQKQYDEALQKEWDYYLSQFSIVVDWAEWLTAATMPPAGAAFASVPGYQYERISFPDPGTVGAGDNSQPWNNYVLPNHQAWGETYAVDPQKDPNLIRPLRRESIKLNGTNRRVLNLTFAVPKELLGQLDTSLGANYNWAFAVSFSAVRLGLKAKAKVLGTRYFVRRMTATTNTGRDLPGYNASTLSTPTMQGSILGEIHTGPFQVDGQQMANARVVIESGSYRTEFQTGAANGGQK